MKDNLVTAGGITRRSACAVVLFVGVEGCPMLPWGFVLVEEIPFYVPVNLVHFVVKLQLQFDSHSLLKSESLPIPLDDKRDR